MVVVHLLVDATAAAAVVSVVAFSGTKESKLAELLKIVLNRISIGTGTL